MSPSTETVPGALRFTVCGPVTLVVALGAFYVLAAVAGPRVADRVGTLALRAGPAAWALEVSDWTARHGPAAAAGLAALAAGGIAASACRRLRPIVTALAALVAICDAAFLACLMLQFYSVPGRLGEQPW